MEYVQRKVFPTSSSWLKTQTLAVGFIYPPETHKACAGIHAVHHVEESTKQL